MYEIQDVAGCEVTPKRVSHTIAEQGWFCFHTMQENGISLSCSFGLQNRGAFTEIVILGVDELFARSMILGMDFLMKSGPVDLSNNTRLAGLLEGYAVQVKTINTDELARLNSISHPKTGITVERAVLLQIPDMKGCLPGDPGCDASFLSCQKTQNISLHGY